MSDDDKAAYTRYRLESARKTYEAARLLAEGRFWNSA